VTKKAMANGPPRVIISVLAAIAAGLIALAVYLATS
jgi:hypothetical protein